MPAALKSGSEVIAVSERTAPTTAIICGSRIASSAAAPATRGGSGSPSEPSSTATKLMPKSPTRPPAWAIASFEASTMSRPTPRAGSGTEA